MITSGNLDGEGGEEEATEKEESGEANKGAEDDEARNFAHGEACSRVEAHPDGTATEPRAADVHAKGIADEGDRDRRFAWAAFFPR